MEFTSQHQCVSCFEFKPYSEFNKNRRGFNGLRSRCKTCERPERKKQMKQYRSTSRAKELKLSWSRSANGKASEQRYRHSILGRSKILAKSARIARVRKGIPHSITYNDVLPLLRSAVESGLVTCESNLPNTASIDRIVPSLGYVPGNIQIIPWWLNAAYHDFPKDEVDKLICQWASSVVSPSQPGR